MPLASSFVIRETFDRPFFLRLPGRGEVAVTEVDQCKFAVLGRRRRPHLRRAVVLNELNDVNTSGYFGQPLLEAHEQVTDLVTLGVSLGFGDAADRERVAFTVMEKLAVPAVPLLLNYGHEVAAPGNVKPISPQQLQKNCRRLGSCVAINYTRNPSTEGGT